MGSDLITILLPVYNDGKYLSECLRSLKSQTYDNFLCLVGFNGTVDNSKEIFSSVTEEDSRFFSVDYGLEKGKAKTLNKLLQKVETDWFCLIDGDDVWMEDKLQKQVELMHKFDIVGSLTTYIDEKSVPGIKISLQEDSCEIRSLILKGRNQIINSSCLVRTECLREIGGWDPEVEGLEDYDVWIKLALKGKSFYNIQEHLVYHRVHQNSNFNSKPLKHTPEYILDKNIREYSK